MGSGLPIAWEADLFWNDGASIRMPIPTATERPLPGYWKRHEPNCNASDYLHITAIRHHPGGTSATLTCASVPTRYYYIQETPSLSPTNWVNNSVGLISPAGSTSHSGFIVKPCARCIGSLALFRDHNSWWSVQNKSTSNGIFWAKKPQIRCCLFFDNFVTLFSRAGHQKSTAHGVSLTIEFD